MRNAVKRFAEEMERQLARHDGLHGGDGWRGEGVTAIALLCSLQRKVAELTVDVCECHDSTANAAHVANFAMMLADTWNRWGGERT